MNITCIYFMESFGEKHFENSQTAVSMKGITYELRSLKLLRDQKRELLQKGNTSVFLQCVLT